MNVNRCLVIGRSGENLALLCRNCRISLNQSCSYAAHGLNREGKRSYIQKKDISCTCIACQLTALDSRTDGNTLIRV